MVRIRPIRQRDIMYISGGEVTQPTGAEDYSIDSSPESTKIFGRVADDTDADKIKENVDIYNKRGHIALAIPVLNFFLAGSEFNVLKKLFPSNDIARIASGQVMYDVNTRSEVTADNQTGKVYNSDILIGGDYLLKLIDDMDVESELLEEALLLAEDAAKVCFKEKLIERCKGVVMKWSFTYDSGAIPVFEDIYCTPTYCGNCLSSSVMKRIEFEIKQNLVKVLDNYESRLTLLLSLRDDKSPLRDQIMENIIVLPVGYRPRFQKKRHKLTVAYDNIIRRNEELKDLIRLSSPSLSTVRTQYVELVNEIKNLMTVKAEVYDKQYKTIMDLLKGKKGLIRDKMEGSRIDYSARSVIIVDPDMSVDTIGVPVGIIERLAELDVFEHLELPKNAKTEDSQNAKRKGNGGNKSIFLRRQLAETRRDMAVKLMDGAYGITGRQPTLYMLGIQGFKIKVVEGSAVKLSPLVCPAFNADFDGDQMHFEIPIGKRAKKEVEKLMASTENIFLPRSGDCHIAPRQEIIHGLWVANTVESGREEPNEVTIHDEDAFLEDIRTQRINVYDTVTLDGECMTAGNAAIKLCLPPSWRGCRLGVIPITRDQSVTEKPVTEKFFKELLREIGIHDRANFVDTVNKLVRLGFAITNIFPPSIPVVNAPDVSYLIDEFDKRISAREELYDLGFETEKAYASFFSTEYDAMESKMNDVLRASFTDENGFVQMMKSGARGNISNIRQTFGMKGRVMKNSVESFNAILKHSLVQQLTGLEHFVTAYGARQGLIDKSIETYGPGYLSRQMSHAAAGFYITTEDCGTKNGIHLTFEFLRQFVDQGSLSGGDLAQVGDVHKLVRKMLIGRYVQEYPEMITTDEEADELYYKYIASTKNGIVQRGTGLHLRSPLTCENPCCVKCYGVNLLTNKIVRVGTPVGFIASQAIGEPGTQLTMKNFQSGGVAGVKNLTSSFQTVQTYFRMVDLAGRTSGTEPISYDFISPVEGEVQTIAMGDGTKRLLILREDSDGNLKNVLRKAVYLYDSVKVKDYVKRGDSIQLIQGDLHINEILELRSPEEAKSYLSVFLFNLFQKEVFVSLKHFEIIVASMSFKLCIKGAHYFKTGLYYTLQEYYSHNHSSSEFIDRLVGVDDVPRYRNDMLDGILYENIQKCVERSIITSGRDELKHPITRYSLGLPLGVGSDIPGYLEV